MYKSEVKTAVPKITKVTKDSQSNIFIFGLAYKLFSLVGHFKRKLQRENKLISYERTFKMLENGTYIAGIGPAVLKLLRFKLISGNDQRGITLVQDFRKSLAI